MKTYILKAYTQRKYILYNVCVKAENEIKAKTIIYEYILINAQKLGYNPNNYIKIEIVKEA